MRQDRIDRVSIRLDDKVQRDAQGYARVWGAVVPINAMLTYGRADGYDTDDRVEFVPEATVNDPAALATLLHAPITMPHPPEMLDATNTSRYQIGTVIDTRIENGELRALHLFTDAAALDRIAGGVVELSPGYTAEIDETPGHFDGQAYAAVQRDRRYNHQAVVDQARAGANNRLIIDSARADTGLRIQIRNDARGKTTMATVTIDDKEFEVADEVAAEILRLQGDSTDKEGEDAEDDEDENQFDEPGAEAAPAPAPAPEGSPEAAPPEVSGTPNALSATVSVTSGKSDGVAALLARMDGLEDRVADRLDQRKKARADAKAKAVRAAKDVFAEVRGVLPQAYNMDGKSAAQIMRDAIVARNPDLKAKADAALGKPGRLRGMLDAELSRSTSLDSHPLGDTTPKPQGKEVWAQRADAAAAANRKYKVLGNEAMRHESVAAVGAK